MPLNPHPTLCFTARLVSEYKELRLAAYGEVSGRARGAAPLALHGVGGWWAPGELTEGVGEAQSAPAMHEWVDWRTIMEWLRSLVIRQPQHGSVFIGRSSVPFQDVRARS